MWFAYVLANYVSAPVERVWLDQDATHHICAIVDGNEYTQSIQKALAGDLHELSYFARHGNIEYIEPITGVGRHPLAPVGCKHKSTNLFDTSHIMIGNACNNTIKRRTILFDMGCSTFKPVSQASGEGSSIPLFIEWFKRGCLPIDAIWAWEAKLINDWWLNVTVHNKMITHFYNTPVDEYQFEEALSLVKAEDYVVVKLDIDNTVTEIKIIGVILKHAHLVDELFFEYHYYFDGHSFGWGTLTNIAHTHNVSSATRLMYRLRKLGIRAHFWV